MKRICHVTSVHSPLDARIFYKECRSLANKYEVYLVAPNIDDIIIDGVHICGVRLSKNRKKRFINLGRVFKKMIEIDAELYHFHDPELMRIASRIKRRGKIVIFDSHEDVPAQILDKPWIPKIFRRPLSWLYSLYEKRHFKYYDGLISVTPIIVERLKKINKNTVQITNFPILDTNEDNRKWRREICFIGSIRPHYMLDRIISILDKLDAKLVLAGSSTSFLDMLKQQKNWSLVDYKGFVNHEDCMRLIQNCMIGICLGYYRPNAGFKKGTLGVLKLFEYMMAGIPVVANDYEIWKEIIDKNKCGICVNPNDDEAIYNAIKYLLDHPNIAQEMGNNGRKAIINHYNWDSQEKKLFDLYSSLLIR